MYITLTRGFFRHSEPVGFGQKIMVRITDIIRADGKKEEHWLGEDVTRHVGSEIHLTSLLGLNNQPLYTGDGYGYYDVRESVPEIIEAIRQATSQAVVSDSGVYGAVRVGGLIEHKSISEPQPMIPSETEKE